MNPRPMLNKRPGLFAELARNRFSYLLVLPAIVYTLLFGYFTLPYMVMAFQKFSYGTNLLTAKWVGFKNFEFFFSSPSLALVTANTLILNGLYIIFVTLFSVVLAILLNELRQGLKTKVLQSALIFPYFLSWVVVSYMVYLFLSTEKGIVNGLLKSVGLEPFAWYNDPGPWTAIITILRVWKDLGMTSVIYLAALVGFDKELFEAAEMDGANRFQRIFRITIPLLLPLIMIMTLLAVGRIFFADFAMIYSIVKDNGLLFPTTDVIDTYVFRALRQTGNPAQAMAVGLYQSILGFLAVWGSNKLTRKYYAEGALF